MKFHFRDSKISKSKQLLFDNVTPCKATCAALRVFLSHISRFFGNPKGINYFNPDKILYNKEKPIVYLSNLKISNELIQPEKENSPLKKIISKTKELVLTHQQNTFSLEYFGIN